MPTKLDTLPEVSQGRRDSAFYENPAPSERVNQEDQDKVRATALYRSERVRTDSGIGGMASPSTINLVMKKCESDLIHSSQAGNNNRVPTISEQTIMLLRKMQILDIKLQSMEAQMKNEQLQRLALEAKVVKLEKVNEQLKSVRAQAGKQLQSFAEMFYAETEIIKTRGSFNLTPYTSHSSLSVLKRRSRTDSLLSSCSANSGSRLSHGSV